ncbi:nucleotidyl transferase AbiEii/AbiGii toxin family protein [Hyphomonas sp. UBA1923]|uniref:nucleotidyl transferase AbiEii/AbiGii toxin family protein n=1 Tax=Hyphomonas sp. UBA1923 TaxID=1946617 RepID=UPI0025B7FBA4|nr:nucleotidyl transferase AbiEii/AbiGii toxin family protein [Hyphomonas sp. UBA1923]|tara:strand:+ start:23194 stop:24120 length:927 start_codon:yes stop_codon:yes gene_type:complete
MPYSEQYRRQVELLVRVLPFVADEPCFALKGGTAINLFVRDMPRLSVDIDLTYLPVQSRADSLEAIDAAMKRIAIASGSGSPAEDIVPASPNKEGAVTKLLARGNGVQIKIEVTPVLRGCVFEAEERTVMPAVEDVFGYAEMQVVSFADLYGGKVVAALDRQHPRDLFDVRDLLANEGITDDLRRAFIVYLLSHDRPMHEVIGPTRKDIGQEFERGFAGMTKEPIDLDELLNARESLINAVVGEMPEDHKAFLIGFEKGSPDWSLLGIEHVPELPAVQWRQLNLDKMSSHARSQLVEQLERKLSEKAT